MKHRELQPELPFNVSDVPPRKDEPVAETLDPIAELEERLSEAEAEYSVGDKRTLSLKAKLERARQLRKDTNKKESGLQTG